MWYPATVSTAATAEPLTLAEALAQCRVEPGDADAEVMAMVAAARAYVERYCGIRLGAQTLVLTCDDFADFAHLPEWPLSGVAITYVDTAGTTQTLAAETYQLRAEEIALAYGAQWPATRPGSRITVTASAGITPPPDVVHALKLLVSHFYDHRAAVDTGMTALPMGVDMLLENHRRF